MTARLFAYIVHKIGTIDDTAAELFAAAKKIDAAAVPTAIVVGAGADLEGACASASAVFPEVWKVANDALVYPNAELVRQALVRLIPQGSIVLVPHNHFGLDLGPGLSIKLNAAFVSDVVGIEGVAGADLKVVRQEFGGQVSTHVRCNIANGIVVNVRPGAFKANEAAASGTVVDKSAAVGTLTAKRRYLTTIVPEAGDVDITKEAVLVSIGRGIGEKDNIPLAEELATALGAVVSCSRPVVDAKWLPKSRQVGSSGQTVKPKVYLACGISGSFQHLAGLKGNPFIVAINKNPKAPIFQVADVGIVTDMLEFIPELTERVCEAKKVTA
ncbi:MAG TPA: electron transfer flavoprotein subunit alpha/FixB family protein [Terracidiphilus sp.]|nr:electron transfer flavoprotein subunit alpha/FixB family protein [Terracidiphilus sp.]